MSLTYVPVIPTNRDITFSGDITFTGTVNLSGATLTAPITLSGAASATDVFTVMVDADTDERLIINAGGGIDFGPGNAAVDTNLYRNGANLLRTDDSLSVGINLDIDGTLTVDGASTLATISQTVAAAGTDALGVRVTGDAVARLVVNGDGSLLWSDGTNPGDTTLNRSAGGGALETAGFFAMGSGQSAGKFSIFNGAADALDFGTAGGGIAITEGANCRLGVSTLVAGTVTVANTSVTANTRVIYCRTTTGGTVGHLSSTQIAGTSFTINSSDAGDTSTVSWLLVEPS